MEDVQEQCGALQGGKGTASGDTLGGDVFDGLTGIETDGLIFVRIEALYQLDYSYLRNLPYWVCLIVIQLGSRIEQKFS
jgi:hypothetical protein